MLEKVYPEEIENGWREAFKYIKSISSLCKTNNIRFILVAIPFSDQVLNVKLDKNLVRDKPQKLLKDFCKNENITYVNMMPALVSNNKSKIYYIKDGHWTKLGHKIAAIEIFKALEL